MNGAAEQWGRAEFFLPWVVVASVVISFDWKTIDQLNRFQQQKVRC